MNLEDIRSAIEKLEGKTRVTVADGITVEVGGVPTRLLCDFIEGVSPVVSAVHAAVRLESNVLSGEGRNEAVVRIITKIAPLVVKHLAELVDKTVAPRGVFMALPHEYGAKILAVWIERNILNPGKLKAWKDALEPLMDQIPSLTTSSEQSATS